MLNGDVDDSTAPNGSPTYGGIASPTMNHMTRGGASPGEIRAKFHIQCLELPCREEMTVRCIDCGHEQPEGESHCQKCGHRFDGGYEGAFEDWNPDHPDEDFYYTYEWFGVEYRIRKWRWDLGVASMFVLSVVVALIFLAAGHWANALIFFLTVSIAAYLMHLIGKRKSSIAALFVVALFVLLPGLMLASVPWQQMHEDYLEDKYAPKLSDTITYTIEAGTRIICDGDVVNYGLTGSQAMVTFTAYGGLPEEGQESEVFDSLRTGTVTTEWIAPDGGSAHVHLECTLSYFNAYGDVHWTIEPYP